MTRKNVAAVYFTEELENEIQERALQHIFISKTRTREDVMKWIHCLRKKELYEHKEEDCSPLCKSKGCSNLRVIDSCWKVCMCHCMFAVPMEIDGYPLLTFPSVHPRTKGRISILWRTSPAVGKTPDPHPKRRLSEIPRMCR